MPKISRRLQLEQDVFETLRKGDVLLHHPFESFEPVTRLLQQAAEDPAVLAIKQTVYRTDAKSLLVDALIDASRAGKEVTAVVELRARFDEARNIDLATRLQAAGANVVYGVVGYKTHAKMLLVVRREEGELRRYFHLGTGNYHPGTARAYTDFGLLSCDPELGEDVHAIFNQLTGLGSVGQPHALLQAPFTLHAALLERIEFEAQEASAGRPARIVAKMNSLSEPSIIAALYSASQAGVEIDLIVRGICMLRPGIPGVRRPFACARSSAASWSIRASTASRRRRGNRLAGERGLDGAQPAPPAGDVLPRAGSQAAQARARRGTRDLPARRPPGMAARRGGDLPAVEPADAERPVIAQDILLEKHTDSARPKLDADLREGEALGLEVGTQEGVLGEPAVGKDDLEGGGSAA